MTAKVSNLAASVQARLQNHARATKRPFQELLQYYAMERFLYRLSTTPHRARFILKGALMLHVWEAPLARATKDVDFLGRTGNSLENLEHVIREVCTAGVEPDGMVFEPATVKTERIKEDADYEGVRVRFVGLLGKARVTMQIDVGFGGPFGANEPWGAALAHWGCFAFRDGRGPGRLRLFRNNGWLCEFACSGRGAYMLWRPARRMISELTQGG